MAERDLRCCPCLEGRKPVGDIAGYRVFEVEYEGRKRALRIPREDAERYEGFEASNGERAREAELPVSRREIGRFDAMIDIWRKLSGEAGDSVVRLIDSGNRPVRWIITEPTPYGFADAIRSGKAGIEDFLAILESLARMHALGFVHLGISPAGIRFFSGGWRFSDFDTAGEEGDSDSIGSPGFCAPEQDGRWDLDRRADIYQMGCLLYSICKGDPRGVPRDGPDYAGVDAAMAEVIGRCLRPRPEDRFPTAEALADGVRDAMEAAASEEAEPEPQSDTGTDQDEAESCYRLGQAHFNGDGVPKDPEKGAELMRKAADLGSVSGMYSLAICYRKGRGVAKSYEDAVKWYRSAADLGHPDAQCNLGYCYEFGEGVTQSLEEAVKWYRRAADQGEQVAQCNLGYCYEEGRGISQSLEEAAKWYRKSADQGYARAQCNLGYCYEEGRGIGQSKEEAARWYRKSADQGYARAQCNLGVMYEFGEGVTQSLEEAVKWYRKSADQGYARAQCNLGVMYEFGRGVEQSQEEAVKWYKKAADQGHARAQCNLGVMYKFGKGIVQSHEGAVKWYRKAADQGFPRAQFNLAICYEKGEGVQASKEEAMRYYKMAADGGFEKAVKALERMRSSREGNGAECDGRLGYGEARRCSSPLPHGQGVRKQRRGGESGCPLAL